MEIKSHLFEIMQFCFLQLFFPFTTYQFCWNLIFSKKWKNTWFSHAQSHMLSNWALQSTVVTDNMIPEIGLWLIASHTVNLLLYFRWKGKKQKRNGATFKHVSKMMTALISALSAVVSIIHIWYSHGHVSLLSLDRVNVCKAYWTQWFWGMAL